MLTPDEIAMRRKAIGSSDVPKILGLGPRRENGRPFRGPLDVWVTKDTASRPGMQLDENDEETDELPPPMIGHLLERTILDIYTRQTKIVVEPGRTVRHPTIPWAVATPDGLASQFSIGCECKVVGARMMHEWPRDSLPAGVEAQCRWAMGVTGRSRWDVAALIGGTDFRIYTLRREMDIERELIRQIEVFWQTYVEGDCEPPTDDPDELQRYLRYRYRNGGAESCLRDDSERTATTVRRLAEVKRQLATFECEEKTLENELCRAAGDHYGIEGPWGRFLWIPMEGRVRWRDVAETIAAGPPATEIVERFRGKPYRVPQLHLAKAKARPNRSRPVVANS
ncbi:MAG: YqaJ viral recombinase family protein [Polyangiaceae bacterium]|nr:YqaJ viral recombinase family protein [Polyangiaceae bacterium]